MQAESGQDLSRIVCRKEFERRAGNGLFCWGVGNAPGTTAAKLAKTHQPITAVFSVMKSRPKAVDVAPKSVTVWRRFIDLSGAERPLPKNMLVTSRTDAAGGPKRAHYALICRSDSPLVLGDYGPFDHTAFRNVGGRGAPIGSSQVTAFLQRVRKDGHLEGSYRINLLAELAESYWVKLTDPVQLSGAKFARMAFWLEKASAHTVSDWDDLVAELRRGETQVSQQPILQTSLF